MYTDGFPSISRYFLYKRFYGNLFSFSLFRKTFSAGAMGKKAEKSDMLKMVYTISNMKEAGQGIINSDSFDFFNTEKEWRIYDAKYIDQAQRNL